MKMNRKQLDLNEKIFGAGCSISSWHINGPMTYVVGAGIKLYWRLFLPGFFTQFPFDPLQSLHFGISKLIKTRIITHLSSSELVAIPEKLNRDQIFFQSMNEFNNGDVG